MTSLFNYRVLTQAVFFILLLFPILISAQVNPVSPTAYQPLVGIPGLENGAQDLNTYINQLYFLSISLAALLAVIKIILGGVQWMLTDIVTNKADAKKDIWGAILGLLVILSAVLLLETINPQLTNLNVLQGAPVFQLGQGSVVGPVLIPQEERQQRIQPSPDGSRLEIRGQTLEEMIRASRTIPEADRQAYIDSLAEGAIAGARGGDLLSRVPPEIRAQVLEQQRHDMRALTPKCPTGAANLSDHAGQGAATRFGASCPAV